MVELGAYFAHLGSRYQIIAEKNFEGTYLACLSLKFKYNKFWRLENGSVYMPDGISVKERKTGATDAIDYYYYE